MKFEDLQFEADPYTPMGIVRARVELPSGNGLSVVFGEYTYSGPDTFEIAPLKDGHLIDIDNWGDQVKGFVTKEEINEILYHAENDTQDEYKDFLEEFFNG